MNKRRHWFLAASLALSSAGALSLLNAQTPASTPEPPASLMGFTTSSAQLQFAAEKKMKSLISPQSLSALHRIVSDRPHMAGTPGGKAISDAIAAKLRSFGLDVEMDGHMAYLSYPKKIRVTLLQPAPLEIPVTEPPLAPEEAAARHPDLMPGFVAYSASGKVRGRVVYANYGLPADYDALKSTGVEVKDRIVIVRYGRVHRAVKVFNAEQRGARGIIIYSDPADDGRAKGDSWPGGMWRHPEFVQRGNAKYSWYYHGDPLTPTFACTPGKKCNSLGAASAPTLPKIPAVAISAAAAEPILRALTGRDVPRSFQGSLPFTYHAGPGAAEVELDVQMENGPRPIYNVIGRLEATTEKDRWVILGTHHDAWTYGGVDPGSACAVLLELARVLGELREGGWQPKRTIVFAFWDAEEYGLIGSTEFAERYAKELREKTVAYINSDLYMGGVLRAGGTASLRDFVAEVARDVASPLALGNPAAYYSILDFWHLKGGVKVPNVELDVLGSGADFVPFQAYLGIPALSLEFGGDSYGSYGVYHSNYDTRWFMEKFGDPGWRYGPALVELLGRTVLRLSSAEILPYRYSHMAQKIGEYLDRAEQTNADAAGKRRIAELGFASVRARLREFQMAAEAAEREAEQHLAHRPSLVEQLRRANDHLARVEKLFIVEDPPNTVTGKMPRWYRHTLYGWNIYALYAGQTLPALNRAIETADTAALAIERRRLEQALKAATAELAQASAAVK